MSGAGGKPLRRKVRKDRGGASLGEKAAPAVLLALAMAACTAGLLPAHVSAFDYTGANLPAKDAAGNYTLGPGDTWNITGGEVLVNGSVVLSGDARLTVSGGAGLTINGDLWVGGRASVNVSGSTMRVNVPEHPPMHIEQLYSAPHGFVLIEEGASMTVTNADFVVTRMPKALMRGAVQPGFGGTGENFTYSVTFTDPDNRPAGPLHVVIDGTACPMAKRDIDDATSRDGILFVFGCETLAPGNHSYHFEGTGPDGPVRYPAAGEIPGPSVGVGEVTYESSSAMVACFGRFTSESSNLTLGSTFYAPLNAVLMWNGTRLSSGATLEVNPTCDFRSSTIPSLAVIQKIGRQTVSLHDCLVGTALVNGATNCLFERCTVASLDCQADSRTTAVACTVGSLRSGQNATCTVDGTTVGAAAPGFPSMRIIADSAVTALNGTQAGRVELAGGGRLYIARSSAERVEASGQSRVFSEYASIGSWSLEDNATLTRTLRLNTALNGSAAAADVDIRLADTGAPVVSTRTGPDGHLSFAVPVSTVSANGTAVTGNVTVTARFRELQTSLSVWLKDDSSEINLSLADRAPPRLSKSGFDYYLRSDGEALVSARADDVGGCGVRSVVVAYSVDGGKWAQRPMYRVGDGRYEGTLPGLGHAGRVQYRVVASDWLDNTAAGPIEERSLGPSDWTVAGALGLVILLGAFGAGFLLASRRRES